ncbi:hypothetical protein COD94_12660 [Bacillus cereus]|nr:hypothetical protein COD94_12660 [Bacillus cereus]
MTFSFPPSETSHLHTNFSMQKETLLQHVFYDYNTFYHFRSTIWQNKRRIDALPFPKIYVNSRYRSHLKTNIFLSRKLSHTKFAK